MEVAIVSGIFLLVGYALSYFTNVKKTKSQEEIAKMQIDERLIDENRVNWDNESRKLIARFIRQAFQLNHLVDRANAVDSQLKLAKDPKLPAKQRVELLKITDKDKEELKTFTKLTSEIVETIAEIRLHIFDSEDDLGNQLLERIVELEQNYSAFKPIPSKDLSDLTELARNYFEKQWKSLTA